MQPLTGARCISAIAWRWAVPHNMLLCHIKSERSMAFYGQCSAGVRKKHCLVNKRVNSCYTWGGLKASALPYRSYCWDFTVVCITCALGEAYWQAVSLWNVKHKAGRLVHFRVFLEACTRHSVEAVKWKNWVSMLAFIFTWRAFCNEKTVMLIHHNMLNLHKKSANLV